MVKCPVHEKCADISRRGRRGIILIVILILYRQRGAFNPSLNCETNPISFKTSCPSSTNNEKISVLAKSKSYEAKDPAYDQNLSLSFRKATEGYGSPRGCPLILIAANELPMLMNAKNEQFLQSDATTHRKACCFFKPLDEKQTRTYCAKGIVRSESSWLY